MNSLYIIMFFFATTAVAQFGEKVIFCYFESWTVYRPVNGTFDVEDINPFLCTHIAFAFLGISSSGSIMVIDPWESDPGGLDGLRRLAALKQQNEDLKVLVSVGGWNEGSANFSEIAADPERRAIFVQEILEFIFTFGFDGLDVDWQYPGRRDSSHTDDRENFVLLLQEFRTAFDPLGLILTAAINGAKLHIDISYNVPAVSFFVDHLNVMSFDFHGSFDGYVGHHTLLYSSPEDDGFNNAEWNVASGIEYLIESGADPAKLNLGIATYGRTFTLLDAKNSSLYTNITGGGSAGPYTQEAGVLGYNEICELYSNVPDVWDDIQQVPHKVVGNQWIGYETTESIGIKVEFALERFLGGFMVWSFDTDDFKGRCGDGNYPLITSIWETLDKNGYKLKKNN